jgi:hypothetical protein
MQLKITNPISDKLKIYCVEKEDGLYFDIKYLCELNILSNAFNVSNFKIDMNAETLTFDI